MTKDQMEQIVQMVEVCEDYADDLFSGSPGERFTGITKWQDGDFRIAVRHGKERMDSPYKQRIEAIFYHHNDGVVIYNDFTRYIDHRFVDHHTRSVLESRRERSSREKH